MKSNMTFEETIMKSFIRIIFTLVILAVVMLSNTMPSWADEPTDTPPETPIETTASTTLYLPLIISPARALVNGNFESGNTGWLVSSTHNLNIIRQSFAPNSVPMHGGSWGAWLGGQNNETNSLRQQITIPAAAPYLAYWHWIGSSDACGYDKATISINGVSVHQYDLCYLTRTYGWVKKVVNLAAYTGQTVTFRLQVQNDVSGNSNLFVDDIAFQGTATLTGDEIAETVVNPADAVGREMGQDEYSWPQP